MRVLLPAPFSPTSACTSPRWISRSTRSFARTPGKTLVIPRSDRMGAERMAGSYPSAAPVAMGKFVQKG